MSKKIKTINYYTFHIGSYGYTPEEAWLNIKEKIPFEELPEVYDIVEVNIKEYKKEIKKGKK
jgi:hypothetical protein